MFVTLLNAATRSSHNSPPHNLSICRGCSNDFRVILVID